MSRLPPSTRSPNDRPSLTTLPLTTEPNLAYDEWAGRTLKRLLGADRPVSETWAFFSGSRKPARIREPAALRGLALDEAVRRFPELLGPQGMDPAHGGQKYFFVKLLDPSDFPPVAYVGFNPDTVRADSADQLKADLAAWLWEDRQALEALAASLRQQLRTREQFETFKAAYKQWAIAQAKTDWGEDTVCDLDPFIPPPQRAAASAHLRRQRAARHRLLRLMHRIDFEADQAILIDAPALHAIAGLSLQVHPTAPGARCPKDEAWIYKEIPWSDGSAGWVLLEPQRTFDVTESGADFFTPFAWSDNAAAPLQFRKAISQAAIQQFVMRLDVTPRPRSSYLRMAQRANWPLPNAHGRVHYHRVIDDPAWPHFTVYELRFVGEGTAALPLAHHSFTELHATRGDIVLMLGASPTAEAPRLKITPAQPVLLPANLPFATASFRAHAPAELAVCTRPRR
jgi:hypothetical protein